MSRCVESPEALDAEMDRIASHLRLTPLDAQLEHYNGGVATALAHVKLLLAALPECRHAAWRRTNDQEATPAGIPDSLLYDPFTGDGDFQYLPLADRVERVREDGVAKGRSQAWQHHSEQVRALREALKDAKSLVEDALQVQREGCDHKGIGKPGCGTCDARILNWRDPIDAALAEGPTP